jgi:trehalose/maltose hydrolase-like predicted phosphorylase
MTRRPYTAASLVSVAALVLLECGPVASPPASAAAPANAGSFELTATDRSSPAYAPTFTGNGYLGVRVPPAGQGYAAGTVPAQSEVAGFYALPSGPDAVQQRANIPSWSGLRFGTGGATFDLATGTVSGWRQRLDLHTGVISTSLRWTAPDGRATDLRYEVSADRAQPQLGTVRLQLTPDWTGTGSVTDLVDGSSATLTSQVGKGWDSSRYEQWEAVRTMGTGITAALASRVTVQPRSAATGDTPVAADVEQTVGQRLDLSVHAGTTYTVTKYVGVVTSQLAADPVGAARSQAASAASTGYPALRTASDAAWAALWAGRVDVAGNAQLATDVNASEFYLWSSTRSGVDWSISPAGLSSNGYGGHVFWDAETWMYPSLLAQHPDLAVGMDNYRFDRLTAAQQHAAATGSAGARFPWESALDGTEQIPPPVSINSEGLFEVHITADVALAQWQYYQATGDLGWLRTRGWPVIQQAATYWASRVTLSPDGRYRLLHVTGPDEENPDVTAEAYTSAAVIRVLRDATAAAQAVGAAAPGSWTAVADGLVVPFDPALAYHPEFSGYGGQLVKQADVTMLQYPWAYPMPKTVAQNDLTAYVQRTDPGGPSMTDAISSIDSSALGTPGCSAYVYTVRSVDPFIRDVFDQFSETSTGGAFTFMTGIGGFLQEFLYGYSGLRWGTDAVALDPSLSGGMTGVTLRNLQWQGRQFTVSIGGVSTTVTLTGGAALPVRVGGVTHQVSAGHPLVLPTARPDLAPTSDPLRCATVTASSARPLGPALAAVDGSTATPWAPVHDPATLTVQLASSRTVGKLVLRWGRQWLPAPAPNVPPPPGPIYTLRAVDYDVLGSADGSHWTTLATVRGQHDGTMDTLRFPAAQVRWLRLQVLSGNHALPPQLEEISASAAP